MKKIFLQTCFQDQLHGISVFKHNFSNMTKNGQLYARHLD